MNARLNIFLNWYSRLDFYVQLLPLLILYIFIAVWFSVASLVGDETRYLQYVDNLMHGYYSPPFPDVFLWNGPGYPFFLYPFRYLGVSLLGLRILNSVLLYFSLILSYQSFRYFSSVKRARAITLIMGLYLPVFQSIPYILTECLSWFLITLFCWLVIKAFRKESFSWHYILLSALTLATLAMTRVIFGYVILAMILISLGLLLWPSRRKLAVRAVLIFSFSMLLCTPWLGYTERMTGKTFYWSDSGGMSLYTMSSPLASDDGRWKNRWQLSRHPYHRDFITIVGRYKPLERDEAFRKMAIQNIKEHPAKYVSNWFMNIGRLFFGLPPGLTILFRNIPVIVYNLFFFFAIIILILKSASAFFRLEVVFQVLLLFFIVYLAGSSLLSVYNRMFYITAPFWFILFLRLYADHPLLSWKAVKEG